MTYHSYRKSCLLPRKYLHACSSDQGNYFTGWDQPQMENMSFVMLILEDKFHRSEGNRK